MKSTLNALDIAVLEAIQRLATNQGYPPTIREVSHAMGRSNTPIYNRLCFLRREGYITWTDGSGRTMRVIKPPRGR